MTAAQDNGRLALLKGLGETFWVKYGHGVTRDERWPSEPGRYAVQSFSERYGELFWETFNTQDAVIDELLTGDSTRIVDLDTGHDVEFALRVDVRWPDA